MPSGKTRDFDDTWKHDELEKSLKGTREDRKKSRDKDRDRSRRREDDDRHHKRREDDDRRERKHRDRENGDVERKEKHRSNRHEGEDRKHRRPKDEEDDRERRHRKHREENGEDKEKRHRRPKEGEERRHKRRDEDEEERRKRKERERRHHDDKERRHHDDKERRHHDDKERRHHDDKERRHREDRERHHDDKERRHHDDKERRHRDDRERRHRDENGERRERRDDEEERRRRHEEKKRQREREKEEARDREREEENRKQREREKQREQEAKEKERRRKEKEAERQKSKEKDEDAYDDYEDDFEDYDDDFEEDDDEGQEAEQTNPSKSRSEVDEIKRAMDEENERLTRNAERDRQRGYDDDSEDDRKPRYNDDSDDGRYSNSRRGDQGRGRPAQRSFINFVSAKQRQITSVASNKARRRGNELSKLIELDFAKFELFDMPPVSEYDLYMRSFGSTGTRQAYVQTGEDNIERDVQTEELETREMFTQHPPDQGNSVGGPDFEHQSEDYKSSDSLQLARFIQRAGALILGVLEEESAFRAQEAQSSSQQSGICLSEAFTELGTSNTELLKGRHVIHSHFSPLQTNLLLTVHSDKSQAGEGEEGGEKGVVCVWNVDEPDHPNKVLVCESRPRCCCFSPVRANLAFAGMHDGSLAVWDLREFSSQHQTVRDGDREMVLRYPTYSTAGVLQYENHQSAVVSVQPIVTPGDSGSGSLGSEGEGMSFQIATLEEHSVIHLWVVAEINQPDPAGSEYDLGLSPGGRVKVIRSSTIQLESPLRDAKLKTTMTAFDMQLLPSNNSHFYVATDTGCVIHGVRYGGKAPPRMYIGETDSPVRVTSIDFSPFPENVFLVGCEDGTLRLHHTDGEHPFIVWPNATGGVCVRSVRWSRSRPSVFFVLDAQARLHIWDLSMSDAVPMKFEQIADEKVTSFEMSNDYSATGRGQPRRKPQMVVCLENGSAEVHTLSREFSALMSDEVDQFSQLIQRIT